MAKNIDKTLFTEEGMTRLRNFNRRAATYFALWIIVAIVAGGGLFYAQLRYGLKPLQRIYLRQYVIASVKTIFSDKRQSKYTFLVRTNADLTAKKPVPKDAFICVTDDEVEPVLDENNRIVRDPKSGLQFKLNPGISAKYFFWRPGRGRDIEMRIWMKEHIYEGRSLLGMSSPMIGVGTCIFFIGMVGTMVRDRRANKRYAKGRYIRGTRQLAPEEYQRANEEADGLGICVYEVKEVTA